MAHSAVCWSARGGIKRNIKDIPPGVVSTISKQLEQKEEPYNLLLLLRLTRAGLCPLSTLESILRVKVLYRDSAPSNFV